MAMFCIARYGLAWHGTFWCLIHRDPAAGKTECSFKQQTLGRRLVGKKHQLSKNPCLPMESGGE